MMHIYMYTSLVLFTNSRRHEAVVSYVNHESRRTEYPRADEFPELAIYLRFFRYAGFALLYNVLNSLSARGHRFSQFAINEDVCRMPKRILNDSTDGPLAHVIHGRRNAQTVDPNLRHVKTPLHHVCPHLFEPPSASPSQTPRFSCSGPQYA